MYRRQFSLGWSMALIAVVLMMSGGAVAASKYKVVFDFGKHGFRPHGNLALDPKGNFYGAMQTCCGPQFDELTDSHSGWKESSWADGGGGYTLANGSPVLDGAGNLYVTTSAGNYDRESYTGGFVHQWIPGDRQLVDIHMFPVNQNGDCLSGSDGCDPQAGVILDQAGNLYGTTTEGGTGNCSGYGCGTIFELSPVSGGGWTEQVLYSFTGTGGDGTLPAAALILDAARNLFGTTAFGGTGSCAGFFPGCGTVFELSPNGIGGWTETVLYSFQGSADGATPITSLILDRAGNLYGTTGEGENGICCGTAFELSPNGVGGWVETVLYAFQGNADGAYPAASLIFDPAGNLYGTTFFGGGSGCSGSGCGTAFKLTPNSSGGWSESLLHAFNNKSGGQNPSSGLTLYKGTLYGTAEYGGIYGKRGGGVMFEITP
jgi:hypothetical protein